MFLAIASIAGCSDKCVDVACSPSPTPLEVIVLDTALVDTTIVEIDGTDTVRRDTTVEVLRATTDAVVTLHLVERERPDTAFHTLASRDNIFFESDTTRLPEMSFAIKAMRNGRGDSTKRGSLTRVQGCCPYPIVGRFTITLPRQ